MEKILIKEKESSATESGWTFEVKVGDGADVTQHAVFVPRDYWQGLTGGKMRPEELVRKSFEFLLQREPKESILRKFELPVIQTYFPEWEEKIKSI